MNDMGNEEKCTTNIVVQQQCPEFDVNKTELRIQGPNR